MTGLAGPPLLSTPDTHIFEHEVSGVPPVTHVARQSDEQLYITYEIARTAQEIRRDQRRRIALQFPDHLLVDAPFVVRALRKELHCVSSRQDGRPPISRTQRETPRHETDDPIKSQNHTEDFKETLFILADTSYGACCVDEVAAEHADADVVVHYGRSCLSPTARLPVIYVFTKPAFDAEHCVEAFKHLHRDVRVKVILMADLPYTEHLPAVHERLKAEGYQNLFLTSIVHDTSSPLPNRTVPENHQNVRDALSDWQIFHISDPPPALLLTLASRVLAVHIYSTSQKSCEDVRAASKMALRRRYALLTSLTTIPVFGILINTLSVRNYMQILNYVKHIIVAAGKKGYTFVVGKVNPAKVANFSEVGGWVVIGCWESSLFESKDFWKPLITPFELELALRRDDERVWTEQWTSDFQTVLDAETDKANDRAPTTVISNDDQHSSDESKQSDMSSEEESEPPEFDLRTGRYVSHARPRGSRKRREPETVEAHEPSRALVHRPKGDVANINGISSPAADHLSNVRTWQGLGSDFDAAAEVDHEGKLRGAAMQEGQSGIARGYTSAVCQSTS